MPGTLKTWRCLSVSSTGAAGSGAYSESEIAYLDSIPNQAKRMAILMYRFSRQ
jgi:hypothetical protein